MTNSIKMNVSKDSATAALVSEIEALAAAKNLVLSRWQTNGTKHRVKITWALHTGERASQAARQNNVVKAITLTALEGSTDRCAAYRGLSQLLTAASNWNAILGGNDDIR